MGPITLFDKSFLQSLNVDESTWFDHFFLTNVCPLFFVETLADLEKSVRDGRTPEQEVGLIADKFPEMHGTPNIYHAHPALNELNGQPTAMDGRIIVPGGRLVKVDGKASAVFDQPEEVKAFNRWQKREFQDVERLYAKAWRQQVNGLDLKELTTRLTALGINGRDCKSLQQAKEIADVFIQNPATDLDKLQLAVLIFKVPYTTASQMINRWIATGRTPLKDYAPYISYILTVEIFFYIALTKGFISPDRASNRVDISYLFYLPFSMVFVSSDKLHRSCAPLFMRSDQEFVWGPDLKQSLKEINAYYLTLPDEIKNQGVMRFADCPPDDHGKLVGALWDRHLNPGYRESLKKRKQHAVRKRTDEEKAADKKMIEEIKRLAEAPSMNPDEVDFDPQSPESMVLKRHVHKRKGSWYQIPKDYKSKAEENSGD